VAQQTLISKDSCVCSKVNHFYNIFLIDSISYVDRSATNPDSNFVQFINRELNSSMSAGEVYPLLDGCNNNSCTFFPAPINIPDVLACENCISCGDINAAIDTFLLADNFGSDTSSTSSVKANYRSMLTSYLNQRFGFQKSYSSYMALSHQCQTYESSFCATTDSLSGLVCSGSSPSPNSIFCYDNYSNIGTYEFCSPNLSESCLPPGMDNRERNFDYFTKADSLAIFGSLNLEAPYRPKYLYGKLYKFKIINDSVYQVLNVYCYQALKDSVVDGVTIFPFEARLIDSVKNVNEFIRFRGSDGTYSVFSSDHVVTRCSSSDTITYSLGGANGVLNYGFPDSLFGYVGIGPYVPCYQFCGYSILGQGNNDSTYEMNPLSTHYIGNDYGQNIALVDTNSHFVSGPIYAALYSHFLSANPSDTVVGLLFRERPVIKNKIYVMEAVYKFKASIDGNTIPGHEGVAIRFLVDSLTTGDSVIFTRIVRDRMPIYIWYANHCVLQHTIWYDLFDEYIPTVHTAPELCGTPYFPPSPIVLNTCDSDNVAWATSNAQQQYQLYMDSMKTDFENEYISHCLQTSESFTVKVPFDEYHYTLYYYDQAGNLVKTVPPAGVHPIASSTTLDSVRLFRNDSSSKMIYPKHNYVSRYWYNTLNEMVKDSSPDADTTHFWYDQLGRIVVSQSSRQAPLNLYSYTIYDALGRIIEAGQVHKSTAMTDATAQSPGALTNWIHSSSTAKRMEVTRTYYDYPRFTIGGFSQNNLRKRVASITYCDSVPNTGYDSTKYTYATHYSYDIEGNVQTLIQDIPAMNNERMRYKRIDYDYDVQSGKVNHVWYQKDSLDRFYQWYQYDADLRLTNVLTSTDNAQWDNDAFYQYFRYGPLARLELGRRQVQGVDYAYTLQGWLKGINSSILSQKIDMGTDGQNSGQHKLFGRDAYSMSLNYYAGDYIPIGGSTYNFEVAISGSGFGSGSPDLYNGNIRGMTLGERGIKGFSKQTIGYTYNYDQLNRLVAMNMYTNVDTANDKWSSGGSPVADYAERVSYEPNGNILTYVRHGNPTLGTPTGNVKMDSLFYNYNSNTNQLKYVHDPVSTGNYSNDIDDEVTSNYNYDGSGNMIKDSSQHLKTIDWTASGKVKDILNAFSHLFIKFGYDALGNRVMKEDSNLSTRIVTFTWYIRDAQGNILNTYQGIKRYNSGGTTLLHDSLWLMESDMYGSSRLGVVNIDSLVYPRPTLFTTDTFRFYLWEGKKQYELTNHLGNVLATVSDKKIYNGGTTVGSGLSVYQVANTYLPEILSAQDYYPFGMVEPGRSYTLTSFDYGFNNKLNDNDVEGAGNWQDYGKREYLPRLARFISTDPITRKYPELTPFQFSSDGPIRNVDQDGLEAAGYEALLDHSLSDLEKGKITKEQYERRLMSFSIGGIAGISISTITYTAPVLWTTFAAEISAMMGIDASTTAIGVGAGAAAGSAYEGEEEIVGKSGAHASMAEGIVDKEGSTRLIKNVDDFVAGQKSRLNDKLGDKIGHNELPFAKGKQGVLDAIEVIRTTLSNPTSTTEIIPKEVVRGNYDLVHIYSSKSGYTVSLRVLGDGKYEFDTLIPGESSKLSYGKK